MTKGLEIARAWRREDGTDSRLAEMINEALKAEFVAGVQSVHALDQSVQIRLGDNVRQLQAKLDEIVNIATR